MQLCPLLAFDTNRRLPYWTDGQITTKLYPLSSTQEKLINNATHGAINRGMLWIAEGCSKYRIEPWRALRNIGVLVSVSVRDWTRNICQVEFRIPLIRIQTLTKAFHALSAYFLMLPPPSWKAHVRIHNRENRLSMCLVSRGLLYTHISAGEIILVLTENWRSRPDELVEEWSSSYTSSAGSTNDWRKDDALYKDVGMDEILILNHKTLAGDGGGDELKANLSPSSIWLQFILLFF